MAYPPSAVAESQSPDERCTFPDPRPLAGARGSSAVRLAINLSVSAAVISRIAVKDAGSIRPAPNVARVNSELAAKPMSAPAVRRRTRVIVDVCYLDFTYRNGPSGYAPLSPEDACSPKSAQK